MYKSGQKNGQYHVGANDGGIRLDVFLCRHSPLFPSKKAAYKAVKRGEALVNGQAVVDPQHRLQSGDKVAVHPDSRPLPPCFPRPLSIVFEDNWLAIVEKPPGLPVSGNFGKTLLRALPYNLDPSSAPDALRSPQTVHRLDGPTGGLILAAKTAAALTDLGRQFEHRDVYKRYQAITAGNVPDHIVLKQTLDGRKASTEIRVLERVSSLNYGQMCRVACYPLSGRKHQIRRHLAEVGSPVVGDRQYGEKGRVLKGKGLFLWSVGLAFQHPVSGESIHATIDPPAKFTALLKREARRTAGMEK